LLKTADSAKAILTFQKWPNPPNMPGL